MQESWKTLSSWGKTKRIIAIIPAIAFPFILFAAICKFFSKQKTHFEIVKGGVSMNCTQWILLILGLCLLFPFMKSKPKGEIIHLFKIVKYAPVLCN